MFALAAFAVPLTVSVIPSRVLSGTFVRRTVTSLLLIVVEATVPAPANVALAEFTPALNRNTTSNARFGPPDRGSTVIALPSARIGRSNVTAFAPVPCTLREKARNVSGDSHCLTSSLQVDNMGF